MNMCTSSLEASSGNVKVRGQTCAAAVRPKTFWDTHTSFYDLRVSNNLNKRWLMQGTLCEPPIIRLTLTSQSSALVSTPLRAKFTSFTQPSSEMNSLRYMVSHGSFKFKLY